MSAVTAFEIVKQALAACPYPVTQKPVAGTQPVYLSFEQIYARPVRASNGMRRAVSTMQVDIWSRQSVSPELYPVMRALEAAGVRVQGWGPQIYEQDTRWHHLPITCQVGEIIDDN